MTRVVAIAIGFAFGMQACTPKLLPAAPTPSKTLPDVTGIVPPPVADKVPVAIEAEDGPAIAWLVDKEASHSTEWTTHVETRTTFYGARGVTSRVETKSDDVHESTTTTSLDLTALCVSPCVAWMQKGDSTLLMTPLNPIHTTEGLEVVDTRVYLHVHDAPLGLRVKMREKKAINPADRASGIGILALGLTDLLVGAILIPFSFTRPSYDADPWLIGGIITAATGALFTGLGALIVYLTRGSVRSAQQTEWELAPGTFQSR